MEQDVCHGCQEAQARLELLVQQVGQLEAFVRTLQGQIKDLQTQLDNRQPPPRSVPDLPPAPPKKSTGRKPGAQPGHRPHLRQLLPPERVTQTITFIPETCAHCQTTLPQEAGPNDPSPTRHQVVDLPPVVATVTEYQGHFRTCPYCGVVAHATIPATLKAHSVGPGLTGVFGFMAGELGMSKRNIEHFSQRIFGAPVSLGTIAHLEQELAAALAAPHAEATQAVHDAPVKNVDETGWYQQGKKRWLWSAVTRLACVFIIHPLRNVDGLRQLAGQSLTGILCSDRWCVYDEWPDPFNRQLCWAHLQRNWEKLAERGGAAKRFADGCLAIHHDVFGLWHRFKEQELTRPQLEELILPLVTAMQEHLHDGCRSSNGRLARFSKRLLKQAPGLWTFVSHAGVEPTNNAAERSLRRAVIWRRRSFGCHSAAGCRFVERLLTVVETLRLQQRDVVGYLAEAIAAHRAKQPAPKLLPLG